MATLIFVLENLLSFLIALKHFWLSIAKFNSFFPNIALVPPFSLVAKGEHQVQCQIISIAVAIPVEEPGDIAKHNPDTGIEVNLFIMSQKHPFLF